MVDGLPDRDVRAIVEAQDGSFLVATRGGAARFDPYGDPSRSHFTSYHVEGGYKAQSVRSIIDAEGAVWIGTDAGLIEVRHNATQLFPLTNTTEQPEVTSLAPDGEGNLWAGSSEGLHFIRDGRPAELVVRGSTTALLAEANTMFAATNRRLITIDLNLHVVKEEPPWGSGRCSRRSAVATAAFG